MTGTTVVAGAPEATLHSAGAAGSRPERGMRPDIQALRAIAVGSVVLFHLWPGGLRGGFVGVDVFFVISGFLITSHLLTELYRSGRVRLGRFWAKRAKRLLPASMLVLAVTGVLVATVVPLGRRSDWLWEVAGAAVYGQNWVLAAKAVDYMHNEDSASPLQHFWSLSVEEQFYVVLPVALALLALLVGLRGRDAGRRWLPRLVPLLLGGVVLVSFAYCVDLTRANTSVAYFHTGTRAWEFAAGGLLACLPAIRSSMVRMIAGWAGGVLLAGSIVLLPGDGTGALAFPGAIAALPVAGAVLAIAAGGAGPVGLLARLRPVTFLGDVSYSVYLWHWGPIVLLPFITGHALSDAEKVAIAAGSVVVAYASTKLVEDPVRRLPARSTRALLLTAACTATAMVLVAGTSVGIAHVDDAEVAHLQSASDLAASGLKGCLGAASVITPRSSCPDLGGRIFPATATLAQDDYNRDDCWDGGATDVKASVCRLAGTRGKHPLRVIAVGDSHNNMYLRAYEQIAKDLGWDFEVTGKGSCAWMARPQAFDDKSQRTACTHWQQEVSSRLLHGRPYDVVITVSRRCCTPAVARPGEDGWQSTTDANLEAWKPVLARGTRIVAVQDDPTMDTDVIACIQRNGLAAATACSRPRKAALGGFDYSEAVGRTRHTALVRTADLFCDRSVCRPVIGHVAAYRDYHHLNQTFVRTMAPILRDRLVAAIKRADADPGPRGRRS